MGHELANPFYIERAIAALLKPVASEPERLRSCRQRIQQEMEQQLQRVELSLSGNDLGAAQSSLRKIDARYGGLAAARILELERTLDALRDNTR
jgi:hypothetical protein